MCPGSHVAGAQGGPGTRAWLATLLRQPHRSTLVVWELEDLMAMILPSAGWDGRSWGLFTHPELLH